MCYDLSCSFQRTSPRVKCLRKAQKWRLGKAPTRNMNKKEQNTKIMLGLAKPPKSTWAEHQNSAWGKHRVVCHMQTKNKKKKLAMI